MNNQFIGLYTALVTPFNSDKSLDYNSLEILIKRQIENHVDGIVILGTTGENSAISDSEFKNIVQFTIDINKKKMKIIVGSGSNNTQKTLERSILARDLGADAIMLVTPYYNKPPQEGIYQHYIRIANSINIPILIYNVKSRTAVNLEIDTILRLSKHKNIVGIKEASGDLLQVMNLIHKTNQKFFVLSGDDSLAFSIMCLGGHGVVSVISNLLPNEMRSIVQQCLVGNYSLAQQNHYKLLDLMSILLSISSNPIPIKTLLAHFSIIKEEFRLPLYGLTDQQKKELIKVYKTYIND